MSVNHVSTSFKKFLSDYNSFRKKNGLDKRKISNVHEILTGMTDKHGRICRYIKHQERKDPKHGWTKSVAGDFVGYLVYAIMLLEHYNINVLDGMEDELNESVRQHSKNKVKT